MAIESPMFQSSMELLGHSFTHFNGSDELDRKLVILHLANSIELILKDLVLDSGESIYKSPKETITIYGCIKILQENGTNIPFLNKIELLIDERNALQHRFGSPNELTAIFYMNIAQEFFKEILQEHYGQEYEEVLTQFVEKKELLAYKMREPSDDAELENLKKLSKLHPLGALLSTMTYFELSLLGFLKTIGLGEEIKKLPPFAIFTHRYLERLVENPPKALMEKLDELRRLRNMAAHGRKEPSKDEVAGAINAVEEFEKFLGTVDIEAAKKLVEEYIEANEKKRGRERERERESKRQTVLPIHEVFESEEKKADK